MESDGLKSSEIEEIVKETKEIKWEYNLYDYCGKTIREIIDKALKEDKKWYMNVVYAKIGKTL